MIPFEALDGSSDSRVLIICDHASALIPDRLVNLGLTGEFRNSHIAWDIGAAAVARRLAERLNCPAVLAGVSRLVIDCNRPPGDPASIPPCSCGIPVPGNFGLTTDEADARAESWFWPYHREIATRLSHLRRSGPPPAVVALHSFTPEMNGVPRPWPVGVLWNRDPRLALPLMDRLAAAGHLVGDNQPYSGHSLNYTLDTHAQAAGLPHASIEIRQDLIAEEAGVEDWSALLAEILPPILDRPEVRQVMVY